MPLYKVQEDNQALSKIDRQEFGNEAELHTLIENNLQTLLGVRFIAGEYPIPNGRIDTIGLDEDGIPVIIEYKWKRDLSAIIQGLFYLDWVMQNRRPFESIVKDKLGKDVSVNWSTQPRLLIIAQDFDVKELAAIKQMAPRIELIKYSLYHGLFNIEGVNILEGKAPRNKPREGQDLEAEAEALLEKLSNRGNDDVRILFAELRERILALSDSVWEKVFPSYADYRTISTFASVNIQKARLKIFIKMGERQIDDPNNLCQPIPEKWGYGHINKQFVISSLDKIEDAMHLIAQAYDFVSA